MFDTVISGGMLVDGTGSVARRADVAIDGDRIAAVGSDIGPSRRTIDARGLHVSPGFIDIHTHSDYTLIADGRALSKIRQGVTTEVIGNCGGFAAPAYGAARTFAESHRERVGEGFEIAWRSFGEYLTALGEQGTACNVVPLVGHANIRSSVIGLEAREATDDEQQAMEQLLERCLDEGAAGMSTGLFYAPGSYAGTDEIIGLARVLARRDRLYATHIRDEGNNTVGVEAALAEAIEIVRQSGVRLQISHLEAIGVPSWGKAPSMLAQIEKARTEGIDVAFDVNPYETTGTHVDGAFTPRWGLEGGRAGLRERFADREQRERLRTEYATTLYERRGGPERVLITAYSAEPSFEGRTLAQISTAAGRDPVDVLLEIAETEDATLVSYSVSEADARMIMQHPLAMISSDGWAVSDDGPLSGGRQHPCDFGTFPRVIEHYVRGQSYWPLETAIAMCTARPAERLRLADRGHVAVGKRADLVLFDFQGVQDNSSLIDPKRFPDGIRYVFVNGQAVVDEGSSTDALPGQLLRGSDAA